MERIKNFLLYGLYTDDNDRGLQDRISRSNRSSFSRYIRSDNLDSSSCGSSTENLEREAGKERIAIGRNRDGHLNYRASVIGMPISTNQEDLDILNKLLKLQEHNEEDNKEEEKNEKNKSDENFQLPERHSSLVKVHVNNEEKNFGHSSNSMLNLKAAGIEPNGNVPFSFTQRLRDKSNTYSNSRNSSYSSLRNEWKLNDDSSSRRSSVNSTVEPVKKVSISQVSTISSAVPQPIALHSKFIGDDLDSFDCKLYNLLTFDPFFPERTHFPHGNDSLIPPLPNDRYFQSIKNNLDITRITDRLVVMGSVWKNITEKRSARNNIDEISYFIKARYQKKFMIWNLSDGTYDYSKFDNQVISFNVSKSLFNMKVLIDICRSLFIWLSIDPGNVAIIHCNNGRNRTGIIVACFLYFSCIFPNVDDGFNYFIKRRCNNDSSWVTNTQRRYSKYFNGIFTYKGHLQNQYALYMCSIILNGIPNFLPNDGGCNPGLEVYQCGKLIYNTTIMSIDDECHPGVFMDENNIIFQFPDVQYLTIEKDIQIRVFHCPDLNNRNNNVTMFNFYFHTGFMTEGAIRVSLQDIELSTHGSNKFKKDFSMDLIFMSCHSNLSESSPNAIKSDSNFKPLSYESFLEKSDSRWLNKLSQHHAVTPDPGLVESLEIQGYNHIVAQYALQVTNNQIHDAHEYLTTDFENTEVFNEIFKETTLHEQGKKKNNRYRRSYALNLMQKDLEALRALGNDDNDDDDEEEEHESSESLVEDTNTDVDENSIKSSSYGNLSPIKENVYTSKESIRSSSSKIHSSRTKLNIDVDDDTYDLDEFIDQYTMESPITDEKDSRSSSLHSLRGSRRNLSASKKSLNGNRSHKASRENLTTIKDDEPLNEPETNKNIPPPPPNPLAAPPPPPPPNPLLAAPPPPPPNPLARGPPPPPLPPMGGAPPPPPLPGMPGSNNAVVDNQKLQVKARLHWNEIKEKNKLVNTIWAEKSLQNIEFEKIDLDIKKFEEIFCIIPSKEPQKIGQTKKPQKVNKSLLDSRRAQNISIGIALFQRRGLSFQDIRNAICNFDDKVLSLDELLSLKPLLPTPEERALLEVYLNNSKSKSNRQFDTPELFLMELMKEPEIDFFMKSFIYKCTFKPESDNLEKCFTQFLTLCENLKDSDNLKILLKTVLALGNLTNHKYSNTIRNSYSYTGADQDKKALGFKIEGLVKLRDVKSTDGKSNLLNYLVDMLKLKKPEILNIANQFPEIKSVRQFDLRDLVHRLKSLETGLFKIKQRMYKNTSNSSTINIIPEEDEDSDKKKENNNDNESSDDDSVSPLTSDPTLQKKIIMPFVEEATNTLIKIYKLVDRCLKAFNDTAEYLGENISEYSPILDVPNDIVKTDSTSSLNGENKNQIKKASNTNLSKNDENLKQPTSVFVTLDTFFQQFQEAVKINEQREEEQRRREKHRSSMLGIQKSKSLSNLPNGFVTEKPLRQQMLDEIRNRDITKFEDAGSKAINMEKLYLKTKKEQEQKLMDEGSENNVSIIPHCQSNVSIN